MKIQPINKNYEHVNHKALRVATSVKKMEKSFYRPANFRKDLHCIVKQLYSRDFHKKEKFDILIDCDDLGNLHGSIMCKTLLVNSDISAIHPLANDKKVIESFTNWVSMWEQKFK